MKIKIILIVGFILVTSSYLIGQTKYVGENKGAVCFSAVFGAVGMSNIYGAQFGYSSGGKVGVGIGYSHSNEYPSGNGFNFQIEYAIVRPKNNGGIGINALGSFVSTWAHTVLVTPALYGFSSTRQDNTIRGNSFIIGTELYLHSIQPLFRVEPFIQVACTFSKITAINISENTSRFSMGIGTDFIFLLSDSNLLIIIPGLVVHENIMPSVIGSISFCHAIK
jgi:hypothetical protein